MTTCDRQLWYQFKYRENPDRTFTVAKSRFDEIKKKFMVSVKSHGTKYEELCGVLAEVKKIYTEESYRDMYGEDISYSARLKYSSLEAVTKSLEDIESIFTIGNLDVIQVTKKEFELLKSIHTYDFLSVKLLADISEEIEDYRRKIEEQRIKRTKIQAAQESVNLSRTIPVKERPSRNIILNVFGGMFVGVIVILVLVHFFK